MFALIDYRCVIALLEERHFGRAARRLGITQPALTARLRRIEAALGARLFERSRSGVEPTTAGSAFIEGARRVLDAAEEAADAARGAQQGYGQTLRVGMTQIAAYQVVPRCLAPFRRANPKARIRLFEGTTAGLEAGLEQRRIDVAFVHPPLHAPGLSERLLATAPVVRCLAGEAGPDAPVIGYPRAEAPVFMGEIGRGEDATGTEPSGIAEADTLLGAIVLSQAGYGPFIAPGDFPHPAVARHAASAAARTGMVLSTSLAWRTLDRRALLRALVETAGALPDKP